MTSIKVTNISGKASERDIWEFFAFSGEIQSIQLEKNEDSFTLTAFVNFVDDKALETALLLTGAVIIDRPISVEPAVGYIPPSSDAFAHKEDRATHQPPASKAEEVVANLLAKGYILSKDAMSNAKSFDERHQLSKTASIKAAAFTESAVNTAASLDRRIGLSQKFQSSAAVVNEQIKSVDEKYGVTDRSKAVFTTAEQKINEAATALLKNQYIASGASWFTGAFNKVTKVAEDVGSKTKEKVQQEKAERGEVPDHSGSLPREPVLSHPDLSLPTAQPSEPAPVAAVGAAQVPAVSQTPP